jgi:hypothetical protein
MEVDDTRPLFVAIEDHRDDGHIVRLRLASGLSDLAYNLLHLQLYAIRVTRGVLGTSHLVERRYSQFANLAAYIQESCSLALPLPPKRMFGNKDLKFVHERREALDVS